MHSEFTPRLDQHTYDPLPVPADATGRTRASIIRCLIQTASPNNTLQSPQVHTILEGGTQSSSNVDSIMEQEPDEKPKQSRFR